MLYDGIMKYRCALLLSESKHMCSDDDVCCANKFDFDMSEFKNKQTHNPTIDTVLTHLNFPSCLRHVK